MSHIKDLEQLLTQDVLIEVNENIKEIQTAIDNCKKPKELKELNAELDYMKQVKLFFDEALEDIKQDNMSQEQALDILEGLEDMRMDNQQV